VQTFQEVENCGFIACVDDEWPITLDNALMKLWEMYHNINSLRIDERVKNARLVEEISIEKKKLEKNTTFS
jgi:hypothetical protein